MDDVLSALATTPNTPSSGWRFVIGFSAVVLVTAFKMARAFRRGRIDKDE